MNEILLYVPEWLAILVWYFGAVTLIIYGLLIISVLAIMATSTSSDANLDPDDGPYRADPDRPTAGGLAARGGKTLADSLDRIQQRYDDIQQEYNADRPTATELAAAGGDAMARTIAELERRGEEAKPGHRIAVLEECVEDLEAEVLKLREFKRLTHTTLDAWNVPKYPDSECRIGKRLAFLCGMLAGRTGDPDPTPILPAPLAEDPS